MKQGDKVTIKGESEEFEILGVRDGLAYLMNDRLMNSGMGAGIYKKLEDLEKVAA